MAVRTPIPAISGSPGIIQPASMMGEGVVQKNRIHGVQCTARRAMVAPIAIYIDTQRVESQGSKFPRAIQSSPTIDSLLLASEKRAGRKQCVRPFMMVARKKGAVSPARWRAQKLRPQVLIPFH
jgi:hypothetical protein